MWVAVNLNQKFEVRCVRVTYVVLLLPGFCSEITCIALHKNNAEKWIYENDLRNIT